MKNRKIKWDVKRVQKVYKKECGGKGVKNEEGCKKWRERKLSKKGQEREVGGGYKESGERM